MPFRVPLDSHDGRCTEVLPISEARGKNICFGCECGWRHLLAVARAALCVSGYGATFIAATVHDSFYFIFKKNP